MKPVTLESVVAELSAHNYKNIETAHIIGLRMPRPNNKVTNKFDDWIVLVVGGRMYGPWKCTTMPGLYYMINPMNENNTCVIHPGQYINCFVRGYHKDYMAIRQCRPIKYYVDANKDGFYDLDENKTQVAIRYTNVHRANPKFESIQVDNYSAGCIVLANPKDFNDMMALALKRGDGPDKNLYTLTVLNWE